MPGIRKSLVFQIINVSSIKDDDRYLFKDVSGGSRTLHKGVRRLA